MDVGCKEDLRSDERRKEGKKGIIFISITTRADHSPLSSLCLTSILVFRLIYETLPLSIDITPSEEYYCGKFSSFFTHAIFCCSFRVSAKIRNLYTNIWVSFTLISTYFFSLMSFFLSKWDHSRWKQYIFVFWNRSFTYLKWE